MAILNLKSIFFATPQELATFVSTSSTVVSVQRIAYDTASSQYVLFYIHS